ncbi:MAG: hypothetical protein HQK57_08185 [Deltaproteobacteria bacterium]|nr:hypothetical protein [Deltaproteobacteria bacterium]MBF0525415.1 hypothetical protein [Deltaproteobacteria bacterium]
MLPFAQVRSLEMAFGPQAVPLIETLEGISNQVKADLSGELATKFDIAELKEITRSDIAELKESTKSDIAEIKVDIAGVKGSINTLREMSKRDIEEVRGEMIASILELKGEIKTMREANRAELLEVKAEIEKFGGRINTLDADLKGRMTSLDADLKGRITSLDNNLKGELKSIRLLMKTLIGLVIFGVSFFSPVGLKLLEYVVKGIR